MLEKAIVSAPAIAIARGRSASRTGRERISVAVATSPGRLRGPGSVVRPYGPIRRVVGRTRRPGGSPPGATPTRGAPRAHAVTALVPRDALYVTDRPPRRPVAPVRVSRTN